MAIDSPTMSQIISNVFDEMLAMPTETISPQAEAFEARRVIASIRISGAAEELVVVEAPLATANLIGETMFAADPGTLQEDEIRDAVGEVVNMIGGNVKGMYEGDSRLSLPCVSEECGIVPKASGEAGATFVNVAGLPILVRWHDMSPAAV